MLYMGKWGTGIVYFPTGGIFGIGYLYDLWTLTFYSALAPKRFHELYIRSSRNELRRNDGGKLNKPLISIC